MKRILETGFTVVLALVISSLLCAPVNAANSIDAFTATATTGSVATPTTDDDYHSLATIELQITSDGSGDAVLTTSEVVGVLHRVVYDVVDSASPSDNWDMVVKTTAEDLTVAGGAANNLSNTTASQEVPKIATVVSSATTHELWRLHDALTFTGDNMGATKTVIVRMYISDYK